MLLCFSIFVHTKDCTDLGICVVRPPINVELFASISVLKFCLGMHALALRNGYSLAARKCSLLLSQKMNQQPKNGCAPLS
jgi:hypothetical protein